MDFSTLHSRLSQGSPARQAGRDAYADAASKAANTKVYQRAVDAVLVNLQGVSYAGQAQSNDAGALGRPRLDAPSQFAEKTKKGSADKFTQLIAGLITLLGDVSVESLKARMETLRSAAKAAAEGSHALSDRYLSAVAKFEASVASANFTKGKLAEAVAKHASAEAELAATEAALSQILEETPEHASALAERDTAKLNVSTALQQFNQAKAAHTAALSNSATEAKKAEALEKQVQDSGRSEQPLLEGMKTQLNAASTMILMMMRFAELMGKNAEDKVGMEQELFQNMQAARQVFLEKQSAEHLRQVAKAEAASKTMGCIGQIAGALLMVVGVVGAAFTGGTSLALAAVGVALMAADMLIKELTGFSVMDAVMKPLMDEVIGPMIQAIGKGITAVLAKMGIDEKSAQMAGMIMGAIIGAVIMVAVVAVVALVGKGAASRLASSMGSMFGKLASKMAPDMIKQMARGVSKSFTNVMTKARSAIGFKSDANSLAMYSSRMGAGVAVTEAGSVAAQSSLQIKAGIHQRDAAVHMADANFAMVISEQLKNHLGDMIQLFDQSMKAKDAVIKKALYVQGSTYSTSLSMARNI